METKKLDARWFGELVELVRGSDDWSQLNKSLQVNREEQQKFFEDEVENPRFKYFYDQGKWDKVSDYESLIGRILSEEPDSFIADLYEQKIAGQIIRLHMMQASAASDDKEFCAHSIRLYGSPKREFFAYIAKRITDTSEGVQHKYKEPAAKRLHKIFSKIDVSKVKISNDILPAPVEEEWSRPLTAKIARDIFADTLKRYEIPDWQIVIDTTESRRIFSVVPGRQQIYIPSDGNLVNRPRTLTRLGAEAIAEHEVGVHVRRAHAGSKQPLRLLELGLRGYLRGEEGIASYVQQQVEGATDYYGIDRYLAASVALGLDGEPRDFRGVFSIMYDYITLTSPLSEPDTERFMLTAWDATLRVFRGTSGETPGAAFTRDLAYLEGNVGIWQLMIDKPHIFPELFVGKFDPLEKTHVDALQNLGILSQW